MQQKPTWRCQVQGNSGAVIGGDIPCSQRCCYAPGQITIGGYHRSCLPQLCGVPQLQRNGFCLDPLVRRFQPGDILSGSVKLCQIWPLLPPVMGHWRWAQS